MAPLQAAASIWRIAAGPRAGRKVLTLTGRGELRPAQRTRERGANAHGFSLHAGMHCEAHDRHGLEQLARYITRPAIANERLAINREGNVVLSKAS
jgi:Putative transposase